MFLRIFYCKWNVDTTQLSTNKVFVYTPLQVPTDQELSANEIATFGVAGQKECSGEVEMRIMWGFRFTLGTTCPYWDM